MDKDFDEVKPIYQDFPIPDDVPEAFHKEDDPKQGNFRNTSYNIFINEEDKVVVDDDASQLEALALSKGKTTRIKPTSGEKSRKPDRNRGTLKDKRNIKPKKSRRSRNSAKNRRGYLNRGNSKRKQYNRLSAGRSRSSLYDRRHKPQSVHPNDMLSQSDASTSSQLKTNQIKPTSDERSGKTDRKLISLKERPSTAQNRSRSRERNTSLCSRNEDQARIQTRNQYSQYELRKGLNSNENCRRHYNEDNSKHKRYDQLSGFRYRSRSYNRRPRARSDHPYMVLPQTLSTPSQRKTNQIEPASDERSGTTDRKLVSLKEKPITAQNRNCSRDRNTSLRSRNEDQARDRYRNQNSQNELHRSRDNSRDRRYNRQSPAEFQSNDQNNNRNENDLSSRYNNVKTDDLIPGKIYNGKVTNIVRFGCFVQIKGVRNRYGLVDISQLGSTRRVVNVSEVVRRGDQVKIKVMTISGKKVSLSMKDVCQKTGKDLNPASHAHLQVKQEGRYLDRRMVTGDFTDNLPTAIYENGSESSNFDREAGPLPQYGDVNKLVKVQNVNTSDGSSATSTTTNTFIFIRPNSTAVSLFKTAAIAKQERYKIYKYKVELLDKIAKNQILILIGKPGIGKTTQIPQYLYEYGLLERGKIGCTQTHPSTTMFAAERVDKQLESELGRKVSYTTPLDSCSNSETKIDYMTDCMLFTKCVEDAILNSYSAIMLDDTYKRSKHTSMLHKMLKNATEKNEDLKLIIITDPSEASEFSHYFNEAPIFEMSEATFPVTVSHIPWRDVITFDYLNDSFNEVIRIHFKYSLSGDILVFVASQEDVDHLWKLLNDQNYISLIVLRVNSTLPFKMQPQIFEPTPPAKRKVIIATNIAETSLVFPNVKFVVDPGFEEKKTYNPRTGKDSVKIVAISQPAARQRAGCAGRTGPGYCFRLYPERHFEEMRTSSEPEIKHDDLSLMILKLKTNENYDLSSLFMDLMDIPPKQLVTAASNYLQLIGAFEPDQSLSRLGLYMADYPLNPTLSKILITSAELGCSKEILTIVSMLSVLNYQDLADRYVSKPPQSGSDLMMILVVYKNWMGSDAYYLDDYMEFNMMSHVHHIRKRLCTIMRSQELNVKSAGSNKIRIRRALCSGLYKNAAKRVSHGVYKTLVDKLTVHIQKSSALYYNQPEWLIHHGLMKVREKRYMCGVTAVDVRWVEEDGSNCFSIEIREVKQQNQHL